MGIGGKRNGVTDFFVIAIANINDVLIGGRTRKIVQNPIKFKGKLYFVMAYMSDHVILFFNVIRASESKIKRH